MEHIITARGGRHAPDKQIVRAVKNGQLIIVNEDIAAVTTSPRDSFAPRDPHRRRRDIETMQHKFAPAPTHPHTARSRFASPYPIVSSVSDGE